jgi:hypothetical protein
MYLISKVKLYKHYDCEEVIFWHDHIIEKASAIDLKEIQSCFPTLFQGEGKKKWNLDYEVGMAIEKIRLSIDDIENKVYSDLFIAALSSILLEVSNLYRNGKCLSYKPNWREQNLSQEDVIKSFSEKVMNEFIPDIRRHQEIVNQGTSSIENYDYVYNDDCRIAIEKYVEDGSVDLVITSPPYLNSRDYTDTYMLELKALGFTKNINDIAILRKKTLRSHVQVKWDDLAEIDNVLLEDTIKRLKEAEEKHAGWNSGIIDMVRLYFVDMERLFSVLSQKIKKGGRVYFNVSNSAYYGIGINSIEICASIAEKNRFLIKEIRKARYLKTSPQQKDIIGKLLEGVIVMERIS